MLPISRGNIMGNNNNNIILTNLHIIDSKLVLDKSYYSMYLYDTSISNYIYVGNITNNNIVGVK